MRGRVGRLIAIEGIDGAGKTTLARALVTRLRQDGVRVRMWREPTDPDLGRLAQRASVRDPWAGAVYFTVDRFVARPALEQLVRTHDLVITDRSAHSTRSYQGSQLAPALRARLDALTKVAARLPDRVVLLVLPPEEALRRVRRRASRRGPLERIRTLRRVARRYRALAASEGWEVVEARRPVDQIVDDVVARLGLARTRPARART